LLLIIDKVKAYYDSIRKRKRWVVLHCKAKERGSHEEAKSKVERQGMILMYYFCVK